MIPRRLAVALAAGLLLAACSGAAPTPASFDPLVPCAGADEQRMAGAYPELEASLPAELDGVAQTNRESGRYCSETTLGALMAAGIEEMRFGAATWDRGGGKAVSLVLFEADGLTANGLFETYETSARATSKVHDIRTSQPTIAGGPAHRMDLLNDESFQAILVWPGDRPGQVRVVLAADLTNDDVQAAADAFR